MSLLRNIARRKQGGSQSMNDSSKGAISAGATLRRYGEQALRDVSGNSYTTSDHCVEL